MASHHKYLSVTKGASSNTNLTVTLETLNASPNVTLTSAPIAVTTTDTAANLARKITDGINTLLTTNTAQFSGSPVFSTETPAATFRVTWTDNCVCVWSQAEFLLTVGLGTTGMKVSNLTHPVFMTLEELTNYSAVCGVELQAAEGADLTEDQRILLLELASAEIVKITCNPFVLSSHLYQELGNLTNSIRLKKRPVVSFDTPRSRKQGIHVDPYAMIGYERDAFRLGNGGVLRYSRGSLLVDTMEPFDLGNEVLVSYIAGYQNIPQVVKRAVCVVADSLSSDPNVKSHRAGDWMVEHFAPAGTEKYIRSILAGYLL